MDADRKRSKGSFFSLFDWNGKSRKKLFASDSESHEGSVEGKEKGGGITNSHSNAVEMSERRAFNHGTNEYSCALSVASDEGYYASRAPGVVARLMGLDSLPTSSIDEPSSTQFLNSQSPRSSQYETALPHLWTEYNPVVFHHVHSRQDAYSWECKDPRPQKLQSRPIERFQTEVLPLKSAKTIPITHHKLLSPIRSPGLMPRKNVAYVMEAAVKIIEASPRATNSKVPSITSSSIPMRIRDLKQKMEAAQVASVVQRTSVLGSVNSKGGQHDCWDVSEGMRSSRVVMPLSKGTSDGFRRRKGMPASPVTRSKATEQRKEGSKSRNIGNTKQKRQNEVKSNVISQRPPTGEKSVAKRTSGRTTSNTLRQNNQKQNVLTNKDGPTSKQSVSNQQVRKVQTKNVPGVSRRTMNKNAYRPEMGSRKMVAGSAKEKPNSSSQKKQLVNTRFTVDTSASGIVSFNKDERVKCTVSMDGFKDMPQHNMKRGTDVVSFTFSSPIKTKPSSQSSSPLELSGGQDTCFKNSSSLPMANVIGADALGSLLEQKLKELTEKVHSSNYKVIREKTSANAHGSTSAPSVGMSRTRPMGNKILFQSSPDVSTSDRLGELQCFLASDSNGSALQKWEQSEPEETEEHSSSSDYSEAGKELECLGPSPVSILEPLFTSGNCSKMRGSKLLSAAQEFRNAISDVESIDVDETEASDSVSFISVADVGLSPLADACTFTGEEKGDWEMNHLKAMLSNAHIILEELVLGQTSSVMETHLFDRIENQEDQLGTEEAQYSKLGQKLLFDCALEWLDSMCARASLGRCKALSSLWTLFQREGWAAEKLYQEILCWRSMESLVVDQLVEKDMSSQYGKWTDFNPEAFEEGVEIEKEILTSLVDEVVYDLLPL